MTQSVDNRIFVNSAIIRPSIANRSETDDDKLEISTHMLVLCPLYISNNAHCQKPSSLMSELPLFLVPLPRTQLLDTLRRLNRTLTPLGIRPSQHRLCFGISPELMSTPPSEALEPIRDLESLVNELMSTSPSEALEPIRDLESLVNELIQERKV